MPSAENVTSAAAAKHESAPPNEQKSVESTQKEQAADPNEKSVPAIQQALSIISNKVRNLEKRKNKLDGYIKEEESGKELSAEQQKAVAKYDEVVQQLSLSKEFCKQFQVIATAASKDAKREARKSLFARQFQETAKVREVLMMQELLQRLKDESIRSDFLNQRNGACPVNKAELEFIEKFAQHVIPTRPEFSNEPSFFGSAKTSADHFSFVIDGRNRQFMDTGFTYEKARDLFNRIQSCGYWEKDVKIVEEIEESRAENDTPTDDFECKEERSDDVGDKSRPVSAPAPTQVPTPIFNGNVGMMPVQQQQQRLPHVHAPMARIPQQQPAPPSAASNVPLKTTVTAVENAYFNQMKYSQPQGQLLSNGLPIQQPPPQTEFAANFSFLQESELDTPAAPGSQQQKMPVNVIQTINQPKHSPVQHQQVSSSMTSQTYKSANFNPQSPMAYPPGLKVQQQPAPHIPVNYQASSQQQQHQQLNQPSTVSSSQVPSSQRPVNGGNQNPSFGGQSQTPPINQQQPTSRPAYPTMVPKAQYQQTQNLSNAKPTEQKPVADGSGDSLNTGESRNAPLEKEDYQQQPQIDTWTNETAAQSAGNFPSTRSSGSFNRNNRSSGGGGGGGGAKYNNYRNSQQSRNYNENGSGDSPREGTAAAGTFFRNNERYNGSNQGSNAGSNPPSGRFENRGGAGANYKPREGNYRAGSGRIAGSGSATAQGSSNSAQRK